MDHHEVGEYWNDNADAWTKLSRDGFDVYRDELNTPAFLEMLPDVSGQRGLDIGCGEGNNTRLLAASGAKMTGIDIASKFIGHAKEFEDNHPIGIDYQVASAVELPFQSESFDFVTGFMSFMDIPELGFVFSEVNRILRPKGFLQFSITHPCFDTPHRKNLRDNYGKTYAIEVGDYFNHLDGEVTEWIFGAASSEARAGLQKFKVPRFNRTISQWLNLLVEKGFKLECVSEPRPTSEAVRRCTFLQDAQVVAYFLHIRVRK